MTMLHSCLRRNWREQGLGSCRTTKPQAKGSNLPPAAPHKLCKPAYVRLQGQKPRSAGIAQDSSSSSSSLQEPEQQQPSSSSSDDVWDYVAPQHVVERNQQFVESQLTGRVILAPLTKGGNLPFRLDPQCFKLGWGGGRGGGITYVV